MQPEPVEYEALAALDGGRRSGRRLAAVLVLGFLVLAVGAWAGYLSGNREGGLEERPSAAPAGAPVPTAPVSSWVAPRRGLPLDTAVIVGGSDVLAERRARSSPVAATCPPDADPITPGPAGQPRPDPAGFLQWRATFHAPSGRMILVDSSSPAGPAAWAFDVCVNAWEKLAPPPLELGHVADLVYDADAQLIVAFGDDPRGSAEPAALDRGPWALDMATGRWRRLAAGPGPRIGMARRIYHPPSGLIVGRALTGEMVALDVDVGTWVQVRQSGETPSHYGMIAYDATADEIVLLQPALLGEGVSHMLLWRFSLGTGTWSLDASASHESPVVAWPPAVAHDAGAGATLIVGGSGLQCPCGDLDPGLDEEPVHSEVAGYRPGTVDGLYVGTDGGMTHCASPAVVYDSVNRRVLCAGSVQYSFDEEGSLLGITRIADVAAFDIARGTWMRLSEP